MHCQTCNADADGQVVWSWRPWAGAKSVDDDRQATVTKKVTDTGESTKQPLTPLAQGMPMLRLILWSLPVCFPLSHTGLWVRPGTWHSLRPPFVEGNCKTRAKSCRGNAEVRIVANGRDRRVG